MDTLLINNILKKNRFTSKHFVGVYPSDQIPNYNKYPHSIVVNLDKSTQEGTHWIAIFIENPNVAYFFDSYGSPPQGMIKTFLKKFGKLKINNFKFQSQLSNVCGHYCITFLFLNSFGYTFSKIIKFFYDLKNPDSFVKLFVQKIIN